MDGSSFVDCWVPGDFLIAMPTVSATTSPSPATMHRAVAAVFRFAGSTVGPSPHALNSPRISARSMTIEVQIERCRAGRYVSPRNIFRIGSPSDRRNGRPVWS